ncbi:MAG TPA: hypothetical protein VMS64_39125 [Candidatus Methylomirabilis sp.]|nr:hypothetical protein [Candidatus Methylomirabilis sp.]
MRHRGHKKAVVAVAHSMLLATYHLLTYQTTFRDLGAHYYDRRDAQRTTRRAVHTLERQGYRGYSRTRSLTGRSCPSVIF